MFKHKLINSFLTLALFACASSIAITSCRTKYSRSKQSPVIIEASFEIYTAHDILYVEYDPFGWWVASEKAGLVCMKSSLTSAIHAVQELSYIDVPGDALTQCVASDADLELLTRTMYQAHLFANSDLN